MAALIGGLQKGNLLWKPDEYTPKTMAELLATVGKVMNAEEAMEAKYKDEKGSTSGVSTRKRVRRGRKVWQMTNSLITPL